MILFSQEGKNNSEKGAVNPKIQQPTPHTFLSIRTPYQSEIIGKYTKFSVDEEKRRRKFAGVLQKSCLIDF
jgi:hypothetical protein